MQRVLGWRARQLAEGWDDLRRLYRDGPPSELQLRELAQFWFHGGWDTTAALATAAEAKPRNMRLVVQPDGDVLLCLPTDFGSVADDGSRASAFISDANRQLAAMRRSLSVNWAALASLGTEIVSVVTGVGGALHGALAEQQMRLVIWLVGPAFIPVLGRLLAKRLVVVLSRIALNRLRADL